MTRFDSHIHLFEHGFGGTTLAGEEVRTYDALRQRAGIERALVVGYEGKGFAGNNAYVLDLAGRHPWIVPFMYLELSPSSPQTGAPTTRAVVDRALSEGAKGFSIYLDSSASGLHEVAPDVWREIRRAGHPVSINAPAVAWNSAVQWAAEYEIPTLVSHLGLPGPTAAEGAESAAEALAPVLALAHLPHVAVKLSGAYAIDPVFPHRGATDAITILLDAFGVERLCWGSDFSPALGAVAPHELLELPAAVHGLTTTEIAAVTGENLARIIGEAV